jgi:hypothetical protein
VTESGERRTAKMACREAAAVNSRGAHAQRNPRNAQTPGTRKHPGKHRAAVRDARHLSGCGRFLGDCTTKHRFPRTVCRHRRTVYDKRCAGRQFWCAAGDGRCAGRGGWCAGRGFACAATRERCAERRAWCAKHLSWYAVWRNARVNRHCGAVHACEQWSSGGFAARERPGY